MVLTKEDFGDLQIFDLLQNVWCYNDELKNNERYKSCVWLQDYLFWSEQYLFVKWCHELPSLSFVLKKIKEQRSLFYPGATANCEKYMEFLLEVKNVNVSYVFLKKTLVELWF